MRTDDPFAAMIEASRQFFAELEATNEKDWFEPRKEHHASEIRKPAEHLADAFAAELGRLTDKAHVGKVYRINRDVRFSKDKSPYNAHLTMLWTQTGADEAPAWYFSHSPHETFLSTGLMNLPGDRLDRFRVLVDERGDALAAALSRANASVGAVIADYGPEPLKRVPKPYGEDHPHADLLRRKVLAVSAPLAQYRLAGGVVDALCGAAKALLPIWRLLHEGM